MNSVHSRFFWINFLHVSSWLLGIRKSHLHKNRYILNQVIILQNRHLGWPGAERATDGTGPQRGLTPGRRYQERKRKNDDK